MPRKKRVDPIPEEFASYEEAAEFWDTHDTTDYPDAFRTVEADIDIGKRRYEVEIDEDVFKTLHTQAQQSGMSINELIGQLVQSRLVAKITMYNRAILLYLLNLKGMKEFQCQSGHSFKH